MARPGGCRGAAAALSVLSAGPEAAVLQRRATDIMMMLPPGWPPSGWPSLAGTLPPD